MNIKIWILANCGYIYEENTSKQQSVVCKFSTLIYLVERPITLDIWAIRPTAWIHLKATASAGKGAREDPRERLALWIYQGTGLHSQVAPGIRHH